MARKIKITGDRRYDAPSGSWPNPGPNDPKFDLYEDSLGEEYWVRTEDMKACSKEKASTLRKILKDMVGRRQSHLKASEIKIMTKSDLAVAVAAHPSSPLFLARHRAGASTNR